MMTRTIPWLAVLLVAGAHDAAGAPPNAVKPDPVTAYLACINVYAARLEPTDERPEDIATSVLYVCDRLRIPALGTMGGLSQPRPDVADREFIASARAQAVTRVIYARACRKLHDCSIPPPPQ